MTKRLATHEPPIEDCSSFLRDICTGFETSQIFMTAHEMGGVFNQLAEEQTADTVAEALSMIPWVTAKLLDVLAAMDLLDKHGDAYVVNPRSNPSLSRGSPIMPVTLPLPGNQEINGWICQTF